MTNFIGFFFQLLLCKSWNLKSCPNYVCKHWTIFTWFWWFQIERLLRVANCGILKLNYLFVMSVKISMRFKLKSSLQTLGALCFIVALYYFYRNGSLHSMTTLHSMAQVRWKSSFNFLCNLDFNVFTCDSCWNIFFALTQYQENCHYQTRWKESET